MKQDPNMAAMKKQPVHYTVLPVQCCLHQQAIQIVWMQTLLPRFILDFLASHIHNRTTVKKF